MLEVYISNYIHALLSYTGIFSSIIHLSIIKKVNDLCSHTYRMRDSHVKHIRVIMLTGNIITMGPNIDVEIISRLLLLICTIFHKQPHTPNEHRQVD